MLMSVLPRAGTMVLASCQQSVKAQQEWDCPRANDRQRGYAEDWNVIGHQYKTNRDRDSANQDTVPGASPPSVHLAASQSVRQSYWFESSAALMIHRRGAAVTNGRWRS
jgi:hypothetical protein